MSSGGSRRWVSPWFSLQRRRSEGSDWDPDDVMSQETVWTATNSRRYCWRKNSIGLYELQITTTRFFVLSSVKSSYISIYLIFIQIYVVHGQILQFSHLTSQVSLFSFFEETWKPINFWIQKCNGDLKIWIRKCLTFVYVNLHLKFSGKKKWYLRPYDFEETQVPLGEMNR